MNAAVSAFTSLRLSADDHQAKRFGLRACTARRMFSSTDRPPNRLVIWNERPTPARVMSSGFSPATAFPATVMKPVSGGNIPETRLNAVVLPAPFGPISACSVRSCTMISAFATA